MTSLAIDQLFGAGRPVKGVRHALGRGREALSSWGSLVTSSAEAARAYDTAASPSGRRAVLDAFVARS